MIVSGDCQAPAMTVRDDDGSWYGVAALEPRQEQEQRFNRFNRFNPLLSPLVETAEAAFLQSGFLEMH